MFLLAQPGKESRFAVISLRERSGFRGKTTPNSASRELTQRVAAVGQLVFRDVGTEIGAERCAEGTGHDRREVAYPRAGERATRGVGLGGYVRIGVGERVRDHGVSSCQMEFVCQQQ
jgi:hypothetical protein